jgi:choloylglycine hydrolase
MSMIHLFSQMTRLTIVTALIGLLRIANLEACTGIKLTAKDGSLVHGRTLEFGIKVDTSIAVVPRGYEFKGTTPNGPGLSYKAKYAAIGAIAFNQLALMDGINEKGLAVGTFYFPGFAGYSEISAANQSKAVSPVEFSNWIVTQFATLDELKAALPNIVIAPTVVKEWGNAAAPFHYIVYDKAGQSLVIEPINGQLVTYDNPLGSFTNSPTFDWHMTNLRNYINMTNFEAKPVKLDGLVFKPLSMGTGMVGIPGDFTSPSRFVRATIFSSAAIPSENSNEAVFQGFHILNQFDIPVGVIREKVDNVVYSDSTMITCVRDPQTLKYYFKTYDDQSIRFADLNKFDLNASAIKQASTVGKQPAHDMSADFKSR